jgi:hypothetical protein
MEQRDQTIQEIRSLAKNWINPGGARLLMGRGVHKQKGFKLRREALFEHLLDTGPNWDALLTQAVDGNRDIDALLCRLEAKILFKLAETKPPPLKWFPKELAMHAADKLFDLSDMSEPRHRGTNRDDTATRDFFVIKMVIKACKDLGLKPTRNEATRDRDSGCSIVAEALNLKESAIKGIWRKRKQFGFP